MLKSYVAAITVSICSISSAAAEDWPAAPSCGFANLGGCKKAIKVGESFSAPRAYAFINKTDLDLWRTERMKYGRNYISLNKAGGVVKIGADIVMIARTYMNPAVREAISKALQNIRNSERSTSLALLIFDFYP